MAGSRAAIRYAKAVLSLASDNKVADKVNADMKQIASAIATNSDLNAMLQSPVVRSSDKLSVLKAVFGDANNATTNLINTLITNKRIALLGDVANKYNHLYDALRDTQVAKVTTATPLTKDLEKKVLAKVKELTGKSTEIMNTVDESILGGFVLRVGDLQYDASIANKLNKLKREFTLN
ncbi:ATP synthase F1 subunit delta [Winogradskyella sp. KYW1333]|uniref:ATP synthase F1 subunit delta n=1 Tax=Winogradskyella sp. KYW1333 TaxID=2282123 RepID=UPI000DF23A4E|nr:ATP synthase F1 subunit delta [Winogradskyella sp. KYW1333]RCT53672.1 ATP synthase F1 subunit delta [Winogradskyella sp. KYW1333]